MKTLYAIVVFAFMLSLSVAGLAQTPVNIVYPIKNGVYPVADIDPATRTVRSAYITASFSVTCKGDHSVSWGFDRTTLGSLDKGRFYDQISVQFVHKLSVGTHSFWVRSDCGSDSVQFTIK